MSSTELVEVDDRSEEQKAADAAAALLVVDTVADVVGEAVAEEIKEELVAELVAPKTFHESLLAHGNAKVREAVMRHGQIDAHGHQLQAYQYKHDTEPEPSTEAEIKAIVRAIQRVNAPRGATWRGPYEGLDQPRYHAKFPVSLHGCNTPTNTDLHRMRVEFRVPPCTQLELCKMYEVDASETLPSLRNQKGSLNVPLDPKAFESRMRRENGVDRRQIHALVVDAKVVEARNTSSVPFRVHLEVPNVAKSTGRSYQVLSSVTGLCAPTPDDDPTAVGQLRTTLEAGHLQGPLIDPLYTMNKDAFESPEARRWTKLNIDQVKRDTLRDYQLKNDPDHLYLYPNRTFKPELPNTVFEFVVASCGHQLIEASKEIDCERSATDPNWKSCLPHFGVSKANNGEEVFIVYTAAFERCLDRLVQDHHLAMAGVNLGAPLRLAFTPVTGAHGWKVAERDALLANKQGLAQPVTIAVTVEFVFLVSGHEFPRVLTEEEYAREVEPFKSYFAHWSKLQAELRAESVRRSDQFLRQELKAMAR